MKMQTWLLTFFLVAAVFADDAPPFDLTILSGKKYLGVTVTRVEGDAIAISHADGIARVFFADLPPELRTKYGYDPNKAAAATAQRAAAMTRQREIDAKNIEAEKQLKAAPFLQAEKEMKARMEAAAKAPKILRDAQGQIMSTTAGQIATNAFTFENCLVRIPLNTVRAPDIQEVSAGNFEIVLRDEDFGGAVPGSSRSISGIVTRQQAMWIQAAQKHARFDPPESKASIYVLVSEPNKHSTKVQIIGDTETGGSFTWKLKYPQW